MRIRLRYGTGAVELEVPEGNVSGVYRPTHRRGAPAHDRALRSALEAVPASSAARGLREEARGHRVLLLVADATRDENHAAILRAALACLRGARTLTVAITTGSHRAQTPGNERIARAARAAAARVDLPEPEILVHDCRRGRFTEHGRTSRGHRVLLSSVLDRAEVILVASDMKHHYFAGYSNPLKDFLPGLAALETIECNHRLALEPEATFGRHPLHPDPSRRTNPVAEDMLEAFELARGQRRPHALVTVTVGGKVAHAELDELPAAAARGIEVVDAFASFRVPPTHHLVVSAGGHPQDETLYLSQRAIELTKAAACEGAKILLLAACEGGIADGRAAYENFYLELTRPLGEVLERIRSGYRLYQHKAYKFAELLRRVERIYLHSALPEEEVRAAHLEPVADPQALLRAWVREDPSSRITFFDEANRLCVLPG